MTGTELFAILKDGGPWGLLAIVAWRWFREMDLRREAEAGRLQDTKEMLKDAITTHADVGHALEKLEEVIKAKVQ